MLTINRLLIVAPPGQGKTVLLKRLLQTYPIGGRVLDPLGELGGTAGKRWDVRPWRWLPELDTDDHDGLRGMLEGMEPGEALIGDEFNRFVPSSAGPDNIILQWLDVARNAACKFALAEKKPTRIHSLIPDLVDTLVFKPWRSASARRWLAEAGADGEYQALPWGRWYMLPIGGDVEVIEDAEITELFERPMLSAKS